LDGFGETLIRGLTRHFIPGLVFYAVAILLPLSYHFGYSFASSHQLLQPTQAGISSLIIGYLLDSCGAYSWHLRRKRYIKEKQWLVEQLQQIANCGTVSIRDPNDPDSYIAALWHRKHDVYERIFNERAEWVAIFESSFACLVGAIALVFSFCIQLADAKSPSWQLAVPLVILLITLSILTAAKGVQRMRAHDLKLIAAMRFLSETETEKAS
jgi:hypothetical protein